MPKGILDKIINISQDKERNEFSPQEMVNSLLSLLPNRENEILRLRYGFNGHPPQTLKAIGKKLNLTRERIRQLEKQALENITKHKKYEEITAPVRHLVLNFLEQHGGLMSLEELTKELVALSRNKEQEEAAIRFLLTNSMTGSDFVNNKEFKPSLRLLDLSIEFVNQVLSELEKIFLKQNKILELREITNFFKSSPFYQSHQEKFLPLLLKNNNDLSKIIFSYLTVSNRFAKTPFKQWGLATWPEVTPKRINAKIYLVMLAAKKPLHFTKITQIINENWSGVKGIKAATVHNELISDKRFVLVGRGTYGLKEWGYEPGTTEQIIEKILKKSSQLLGKEEIIKQVKEKKMVKDATIKLALRNKEKFEKTVDGKYKLKETKR